MNKFFQIFGKVVAGLIVLSVLFVVGYRFTIRNQIKMTGVSMMPTISDGETINVDYKAYNDQAPQAGDIVIYEARHGGAYAIARVIGVPGDEIEISANELVINGKDVQGPSQRPTRPGRYGEHVVTSEKTETLNGQTYSLWINESASHLQSRSRHQIPGSVDSYFLETDFRGAGYASSLSGPVPRSRILGRAIGVAKQL